jgi:hypothetical protein
MSVTFGMSARSFSTNCCDATCVPEMKMALTPSVFHRSTKLSSWFCAAVVSEPEMLRIAVVPVFSELLQLGLDTVLDNALTGRLAEYRDGLAVERVLLLHEADEDRVDPFRIHSRFDDEPGWRLIHDRLRQLERHQHGVVLLRETRLRVTGEVDEVAEHCEDLVVLRELRAQRDRRRAADRTEAVGTRRGSWSRPTRPSSPSSRTPRARLRRPIATRRRASASDAPLPDYPDDPPLGRHLTSN